MPSRRTTILLAITILALAAVLRLRGLDTTSLWGDQAFTLNTAMRWVNGGPVPLAANKSSVGIMNPPMIEYLYGAALASWGDILSVSLLTVLGGLVAVAVTGYVTARIFGRRAGLWAMLAFAVAPWAVAWSQLIWNQTMVPPFATLALGGLLLYLAVAPRWPYLVVSFAAAAAMTQLHPGSAVQLGTIGLSLLIFHRRVRWHHVAAAAAVFALLYLPYLLYQAGTNWADVTAAREVAGQPATFSLAAVLLSLDLIRAQGLYRSVANVDLFDALSALLFAAALALVLARAAGWPRGEGNEAAAAERPAIIVLLIWFAAPLLFYLRSAVYLQNYYLIGQWPAHFMILGIGLDTAQRAAASRAGRATTEGKRRGWTALVWLLPLPLLVLCAYQAFFVLRYQDARAAGNEPHVQVRHIRQALASANRLLAEYPHCRLVGVGRGGQVENSDLALLQEFTDPDRVLLTDGELALPLPAPCGLYLSARPGSPADYWLGANARPVEGADVPVKNEVWPFYVWDAPDEAAADLSGAPRWDNGLALVGYFRGDANRGQPLDLSLTWQVTEAAGAIYHFGTYLLGEGDAVAAQQDGAGFDSVQWRPGDRFITWHDLPIPPDLPAGTYRTAVALYTWPDLVRSAVSTGGNTGYLEQIVLP